MRVNADFERPARIGPEAHRWIASPQAGVERVMLDRVGGEVARATSLVRYGPASTFPRHEHGGGEEILVLAGTFSDETGDYPAGWYLRNPPGSAHRPFSRSGAVLFVKLWQMAPDEDRTVRIDTGDPEAWKAGAPGAVCALFPDAAETVCLRRLEAGQTLSLESRDGLELLITAGRPVIDGAPCPPWTWLRFPPGAQVRVETGRTEATFYQKTGHLAGRA